MLLFVSRLAVWVNQSAQEEADYIPVVSIIIIYIVTITPISELLTVIIIIMKAEFMFVAFYCTFGGLGSSCDITSRYVAALVVTSLPVMELCQRSRCPVEWMPGRLLSTFQKILFSLKYFLLSSLSFVYHFLLFFRIPLIGYHLEFAALA